MNENWIKHENEELDIELRSDVHYEIEFGVTGGNRRAKNARVRYRKPKSNTYPFHGFAGATAGGKGHSGYLVDVLARCLRTAQEGVRKINDGERAAVSLRDVDRCIKVSHAVLYALLPFLQLFVSFQHVDGVLVNTSPPAPHLSILSRTRNQLSYNDDMQNISMPLISNYVTTAGPLCFMQKHVRFDAGAGQY